MKPTKEQLKKVLAELEKNEFRIPGDAVMKASSKDIDPDKSMIVLRYKKRPKEYAYNRFVTAWPQSVSLHKSAPELDKTSWVIQYDGVILKTLWAILRSPTAAFWFSSKIKEGQALTKKKITDMPLPVNVVSDS